MISLYFESVLMCKSANNILGILRTFGQKLRCYRISEVWWMAELAKSPGWKLEMVSLIVDMMALMMMVIRETLDHLLLHHHSKIFDQMVHYPDLAGIIYKWTQTYLSFLSCFLFLKDSLLSGVSFHFFPLPVYVYTAFTASYKLKYLNRARTVEAVLTICLWQHLRLIFSSSG